MPNFYCVFGGAPIESRDGESLEGVGETRLTTGTIFTDKLFTGQREMAGLGIYHYNARFYSPKLGRFLSPDTIVPGAANPQAWNRYSYVLGNPLKYIDPSGHSQCQTQEDCADMGTTPMGTGGNGGGGGNGGRDGCRHNDPDCHDGGGGGNGGNHEDDTVINPSGPYIGVPQDLGESLSGVWVGGGQPNDYYVGGYTPEKEGDRVYLAGVGAGLRYNATYGIEFFENGVKITINERYTLSENTFYTDVASAGSILNVKTSDGIAHQLSLGQIDVGKNQIRNTSINVYGSYPSEMHVTIIINLSQTLVTSAPLPVFEFFNDPSVVAP